ncbi:Rho GTPase activation protein [Syncephalis fuscata]|nr:Rho GTPase activation protein [Syncephalis fuscata]
MSFWSRALSLGWEAEQEGATQHRRHASDYTATANSAARRSIVDKDDANYSSDDVVFPDHLENEQVLKEFVDSSVIYQAGNDYEGRPMIVFFACHLPDPQRANYDLVLDHILAKLDQYVENDYTTILFSGGARYRPGWSWLFKAYNQLGRKYKKNLKKLYVVHPSMWVRLLMDMMKAVISPKFARKLSYVSTLSELATQIPLKKIQLPRAVLSHNLKYEACITYPKSKPRMFGQPLEKIMGPDGLRNYPLVVLECVELLRDRALHKDGIFRRSACASDLRAVRSSYDQGEAVDLSSYDDYMVAVLLKLFFHELSPPLFPTEKYEAIRQIPVHEPIDAQILYIQSILLATMSRPAYLLTRYVFGLLHETSKHSESNLMNVNNLAMVWAPNLVHGPDPMEDMQLFYNSGQQGCVGTFIRLSLDHYYAMFEIEEIERVPRPFTQALHQLQAEEEEEDTIADMQQMNINAKLYRRRSSRQRRTQSEIQVDVTTLNNHHELRRAPSSPSIAVPAQRSRPTSFAAEFGPMSMPSNAADLRRSLPPLSQRSAVDEPTSPRQRAHTTISDGTEYQ